MDEPHWADFAIHRLNCCCHVLIYFTRGFNETTLATKEFWNVGSRNSSLIQLILLHSTFSSSTFEAKQFIHNTYVFLHGSSLSGAPVSKGTKQFTCSSQTSKERCFSRGARALQPALYCLYIVSLYIKRLAVVRVHSHGKQSIQASNRPPSHLKAAPRQFTLEPAAVLTDVNKLIHEQNEQKKTLQWRTGNRGCNNMHWQTLWALFPCKSQMYNAITLHDRCNNTVIVIINVCLS